MQDHLGRAVYFRLNVIVRAVGNARLAKVAEDVGGRGAPHSTPRLWREQRA